ncbi:DUF2783 domain-containing protein [Epibacterium sp. SM1979]|uniref:DUF2783 domain-containing protein n=1 Tax=Tritonibacter litoralis TaxID=2662264 RepID=A0A843YFF1_9RHOB|nr:DUF2783 domain-containing protein [Tritonibacter litoralis]MQQ07819.1 DUF2783 domain-containing protein [Tritonibacter litoralis]
MSDLNLKPNLAAPDAFYEELIATHEGLQDDESAALNARLILILANHIGDSDVLSAAMKLAKDPASVSS